MVLEFSSVAENFRGNRNPAAAVAVAAGELDEILAAAVALGSDGSLDGEGEILVAAGSPRKSAVADFDGEQVENLDENHHPERREIRTGLGERAEGAVMAAGAVVESPGASDHPVA